MKSVIRLLPACALVALSTSLFAASSSAIGDIVKAQILIGKVMQIVDKYKATTTVELQAPTPVAGNTGKYLLPYKANGEVTAWAEKSFNAQAGKVIGEKAGDAATKAVASKIPFGGVAGGLIKKKTKEIAGVTALGGMDFIKENSDISTESLNDYAVYLHVKHSKDSNYKEVLAAAMSIYPDLEGRMEGAVADAYKTQSAKAAAAAK
jgi:hypothetical protein